MSSNLLKPKKCPACGERTVPEVVYGLPGRDLFEARERNDVIVGGGCIGPPFIGRPLACLEYDWEGAMCRCHRSLISKDDTLALVAVHYALEANPHWSTVTQDFATQIVELIRAATSRPSAMQQLPAGLQLETC